ncbi:MAG: type IX secretion system membrane protein PorP/SprF [Saprospiraceae bacterium]|nr:type IX secretion system membrane protein PorP/SprF [Saprospiraceae bacterium]
MKKLMYTLLITFITASAWAQSEAIYTFNLFNQLNFNPAYAGSKEVLDAGLIYRNQWWSGIDGSPKNINLYGHMPFAKLTSGIGLNILTDKIGLDKVLTVGADYAYRIRFNSNNVLALGIGARIENARADWDEVNAAVAGNDPRIGDGTESKSTFNVGPGVYFNNRKFYLGASLPRMLANSLYNEKDEFSQKVNTWFFQGGLTLPLSQNVELLPNVQVRYNPNSPFDFDANLNVMFYDALMVGAMYRYEDAISGLLVYQFKNGFRLGAAIDFTTSALKEATTGSFELMAGYTFPCEDCKIKSLRYF